ncbi:ester cyclase [Tritonibacter horizontis]|uniref:SnoaL-like polyketide cyclase n=1 Tax=Tritonibacter horizontis TaxID=1768241 RepID=A0A132BU58_9RHOB|nr:nuclear transport factor 2 family protein [Tritonibacter horizontis]KUP91357.1 snoaL-like polyketide cyclase [Tritonibacter horizontis]
MKNSALLHLWFEEVWNKDNLDIVDELLDPDVIFNGALDAVVSPGVDYKEVVTAMKALLDQIKVTVTHSIEDGDLAMVRVRVDALDSSHRRKLDFTGQMLVRVRNGRFFEFYSNFDYLRMFEQLGQIPTDALPVCLTGERLVWVE